MSALDLIWQRLRLELLSIADGPITAYNTNRVDEGKPGDKPPRHAGEELAELEARWNGCHSDRSRRAVLADTLLAIQRARVRKLEPTQKRDTQEWQEAIALDVRGVTVVAYSYGIGVKRVEEIRQKFGIPKRPVGRPVGSIRNG